MVPVTDFSPGACDDSDGTPPAIVNGGGNGTFHGYLVMTVTSPIYTPGTASCAFPCPVRDSLS